MERRVCRFFQQGNCRNGTNCNFLHDNENNPPRGMGIVGFPQMGTKMADDIITQKIYEKNENESGSKICKFFLEGNCKHQICYSIHAYSQHLDHVIFDEDFHSNTIIGMCQITEENNFCVWEITDTKKFIGKQQFENEKIKKIFHFNGKIIVLTVIEKMISSKPRLHIFSDNFTCSLDIQNIKSVNDIIEVENCILGVGDNMIISFLLDQNGALTQGKFAVNEKEKSEIVCINFNENLKMFFCGHNSGNISAWKISEETKFLVCVANSNENVRVHDDIVNYLTFKDNFLISCSSDNYLKVFNLDNNFENVLSKNYECPVLSIGFTKNESHAECFLINLSNGTILITDQMFNTIIKIPSLRNSSQRYFININNKLKNENDGNFLIISDGNGLNVNMWVKNIADTLKNKNSNTTKNNSHHKSQNYSKGGNPNQNSYQNQGQNQQNFGSEFNRSNYGNNNNNYRGRGGTNYHQNQRGNGLGNGSSGQGRGHHMGNHQQIVGRGGGFRSGNN